MPYIQWHSYLSIPLFLIVTLHSSFYLLISSFFDSTTLCTISGMLGCYLQQFYIENHISGCRFGILPTDGERPHSSFSTSPTPYLPEAPALVYSIIASCANLPVISHLGKFPPNRARLRKMPVPFVNICRIQVAVVMVHRIVCQDTVAQAYLWNVQFCDL